MKKKIYIILFVIFGILLQFLIHGIIEVWYIGLLTSDFPKYGFELNWSQWFIIHHAATVILLVWGILFGFFSGKFFWHKIYEK